MTRRPTALISIALLAVTSLVAALVAVGAPGAATARRTPDLASAKKLGALPILSYRGVADPSVVRYAGGWVAVATGPAAPRAVAPTPGGPWQNIASALTVLPTWATSSRIWASDLAQVGTSWVLYFSAETAGLGIDGRCIGTAVATDPTQPFVPDERPLVCQKQGAAPRAYDRLKRRDRDLPVAGVIDPEHFADRDGKQYLLYRTQGTPSSIRIVPLPPSGRGQDLTTSNRSTELVTRRGVIENPTLLRRGRTYVLITSEGDFVGCGYKTTVRQSVDLMDWSGAKRQALLSRSKTGLCGPGGADTGYGPNGEPLLFFHSWTCPAVGNCPLGANYDATNALSARRSLFAGSLRFTKSKAPRIASWVLPVAPAPVAPVEPPPA